MHATQHHPPDFKKSNQNFILCVDKFNSIHTTISNPIINLKDRRLLSDMILKIIFKNRVCWFIIYLEQIEMKFIRCTY